MPTYEYACRDCDERLEVVQSFTDDRLTECPNCGGELRKVFSAAPIVFKGSGWHITDYGTSDKPRQPHAKASNGGQTSDDGSDTESSGSSTDDTSTSAETSAASGSASSAPDGTEGRKSA